ncbi:MAG: flagellar hook-length control protein FliK [Pontiellaceae bacterium]|nr:flagellar hook-length control protein FliK [Pontiellaceae bacterium]
MEKLLSSAPGVETPGKMQSEEKTPAAGFLALLGLEVEDSLSNKGPLAVEIKQGAVPEGAVPESEVKKQMLGAEENWGGVPLTYVGKKSVGAKEKVQGSISEMVNQDLPKGGPVVEKERLFQSMTKWAKPKPSGDVPLAMPEEDDAEGAAAAQIASVPKIKKSAVPESEVKKLLFGPEENWGGVPLTYVGEMSVSAKEKVQGNISEAVESDLPKGVPVVEKERLFESMTKWAKPKPSGDVPLALPEEDEAEGVAAAQIAPVTGPAVVHPDQIETVQMAGFEEKIVDEKMPEQVPQEEMTMVHRRIVVHENAETPVAPVDSENGSVVSEAVEDGLSTVPETQNAADSVEEMVHRVPPMSLQAVSTPAEKQSNFVKAVKTDVSVFPSVESKAAEAAVPLADAAPPAMMLKEVPLHMEEVVTRMVPSARIQVERDGAVEKKGMAPVVPVAVESGPPKMASAPAAPPAPPMNLPSAPQTNETTMRLEQLSNQFDQRLLSMVQQNEKVMRITMEPATMGKMTVLCREENASLTVEIHVQHPAVRELIARQEDDIRRVMQECNMDVGGFDVLMSEQHNEQRQSTFGRSDAPWKFHGIAPATNESETVGEKPVYHRRHATSWVA